MKKLITIIFICCLLIIPVAAEDENPITTELDTGWSETAYPTAAGSSWFKQIWAFLSDLNSGWTNNSYAPIKAAGSWYEWVFNKLNTFTTNFSTVNTNLGDILIAVRGLDQTSNTNNIISYINDSISSTDSISDTLIDLLGSYNSYNTFVHPIVRSSSDYIASAGANQNTPNLRRHPLLLIFDTNGRLYFSDNDKSVESPMDMMSIINSNLFMLGNVMMTLNTKYFSHQFDQNTGQTVRFQAYSISDFLDISLGSIVDSVGRLAYVFADNQKIQILKDQAENIEAAAASFMNPDSGSNSIKLSDIGNVSDVGSHISDLLNTGGSVSGFINATSTSGGLFSWFSQDCADDLDTTTDNQILLMGTQESDFDKFDRYYSNLNLTEDDLYD